MSIVMGTAEHAVPVLRPPRARSWSLPGQTPSPRARTTSPACTWPTTPSAGTSPTSPPPPAARRGRRRRVDARWPRAGSGSPGPAPPPHHRGHDAVAAAARARRRGRGHRRPGDAGGDGGRAPAGRPAAGRVRARASPRWRTLPLRHGRAAGRAGRGPPATPSARTCGTRRPRRCRCCSATCRPRAGSASRTPPARAAAPRTCPSSCRGAPRAWTGESLGPAVAVAGGTPMRVLLWAFRGRFERGERVAFRYV